VRASDAAPDGAEQASHGHTMVYSTAARKQEELSEHPSAPRGRPVLVAEGKRVAIGPHGAVIGRSRECDVVLADGNVSRRHAELRPAAGGWSITDLGSTNGVKVNGRPVHGAYPVAPGDHIEVGTVDVRFEVL